MPDFIPGLDAEFPDLAYDAALIGSGSEVSGFDTPLSSDHHWGPRCGEAIAELFRFRLPYEFRGCPTSFETIPYEPGVLRFEPRTSGPVNHRIEVTTLRHFLGWYLAFDWSREAHIEPADWLTIPQQNCARSWRCVVLSAGKRSGAAFGPAACDRFH